MEYLVTKIVEINSKKLRIELNYELIFSLYRGEIRKYKLKEGSILSEKSYSEIFEDVLPKRAFERCINLLSRRSMTSMELRRKLRDGLYPEEIIDMTIEKLINYKLVNDEDYVANYLETYKNSRSIRQIKQELMKKGITGELIKDELEDLDVNEEENIYKLMNKKGFNPFDAEDNDRNKFAAFLMRKGYGYDLIRKCVFK